MKVNLSGIFRARVFNENYKLIKDVATGNSLTVRGAFEIIGRMARIGGPGASADFYGGPVNDFIGVFSPAIFPIQENNFVALSREDRIKYFDNNNNPLPLLGDNRQWESDQLNGDIVDWGSFFAEPDVGNDYPTLVQGLPSPFTNQATATIVLRPGSQVYRGFYVQHKIENQFANRSVNAVLASAVLDQPLFIGANDFLHISWTLKIDPTFP